MYLGYKSIPEKLKECMKKYDVSKLELYNKLKNKIPISKQTVRRIVEENVPPTTTQLIYIMDVMDLETEEVVNERIRMRYKSKPKRQNIFTEKFKFLVMKELDNDNYKNREKLSESMNMISANTSNYFRGVALPGLLNLIKICRFFKVTPNFFNGEPTNINADGKILREELCRIIANEQDCKVNDKDEVSEYLDKVLDTGTKENNYINVNGSLIRKKVSEDGTELFWLDDRFSLINFINEFKSVEESDKTKNEYIEKETNSLKQNENNNKDKSDEEIELEEIVDNHISVMLEKIEDNIRDVVESYIIYVEDKYRDKINDLKTRNSNGKIDKLKEKIKELKNELSDRKIEISKLKTKLDDNKNKLSEIRRMLK